jgi:hypothetical protein
MLKKQTFISSLSLFLVLFFAYAEKAISYHPMQYHPKTDLTEKLISEGLIKTQDVDGYSMKGLKEWHVNLSLPRTDNQALYILQVFKLISYTFSIVTKSLNCRVPVFPTWFIYLLVKNKIMFQTDLFFLLKFFCILGEKAELLSRGISLILRGNFTRIMEAIRLGK